LKIVGVGTDSRITLAQSDCPAVAVTIGCKADISQSAEIVALAANRPQTLL